MGEAAEKGTGAEPEPDTGALVRFDSGRQVAAVYAFFAVAAVVMTWPVGARLASHMPGVAGDPEVYLWNIWWLKFSLLERLQNPLWCSWMLWPFGGSFAFHTHTIVYGLVALALEPLGIGAATALSLLFLNSFALTGLGVYLWCREYRATRAGALLGGFFVAFCHYRMGRGVGHYNLLATEFLPFLWLALKRGIESGKVRPFVWVGVFAVVVFWQEAQIFLFAGFFAAMQLAAAIVGKPRRAAQWAFWRGLLIAAAIVLLGMLPYLVSVVPALRAGEYEARAGSPVIGADLLSFFVPHPFHPLFGRWTQAVYKRFQFGWLDTAYLGYAALALAVIGFWVGRREKKRLWWMAATAVFFLLLTFGDQLRVGGQSEFRWFGKLYSIRLPGRWIGELPMMEQFRAFSRFVILSVFALAVPVALGAGWIEQVSARRRWVKGTVVAALLVLVAIEDLFWPYLTHPHKMPQFAPFASLERIRNDPETATVFTVPPTLRSMEEQYMQFFHGKPIYGGELSRMPLQLFWHYEGMPVIGNFITYRQEYLDEGAATRVLTREFANRFIDMHNIKYLVLGYAAKRDLIQRLIEGSFPIVEKWDEGQFRVYLLQRPPTTAPLAIDFAQPSGALYVWRNFSPPGDLGVWAFKHDATLALPIHGKRWKALAVEMTPFVYDRTVTQTAQLWLNDRRLGEVSLKPELARYQFEIPAGALDDRPYSTLRFRFGYCESPRAKAISPDRRTLAAAVRRLEVLDEARPDVPMAGP